jgi:hypothetical protein
MRCLVVLAERIGLMNQEPADEPREPRTISRTCSGAPAVRTLAARSCACGKLTLARRSRRLETAIAGTDNSSTPKPTARTAQSGSLATPPQTQTLVLVAPSIANAAAGTSIMTPTSMSAVLPDLVDEPQDVAERGGHGRHDGDGTERGSAGHRSQLRREQFGLLPS